MPWTRDPGCRSGGCDRKADSQSFTEGYCLKHYNATRAHQRPPVCVCDRPLPDAIGECATCHRPYKPGVFDDVRDAWRKAISA